MSLQSRIVADYAVVPLLGCEVEATVGEVVTNAWLVRKHYSSLKYSFAGYLNTKSVNVYLLGSSIQVNWCLHLSTV